MKLYCSLLKKVNSTEQPRKLHKHVKTTVKKKQRKISLVCFIFKKFCSFFLPVACSISRDRRVSSGTASLSFSASSSFPGSCPFCTSTFAKIQMLMLKKDKTTKFQIFIHSNFSIKSCTDFVTYLQTNDRHACGLRSKPFSNACL